jgi:hypothetical protein
MGLTHYRSIDKYSLPDVARFAKALRRTGAGVEAWRALVMRQTGSFFMPSSASLREFTRASMFTPPDIGNYR